MFLSRYTFRVKDICIMQKENLVFLYFKFPRNTKQLLFKINICFRWLYCLSTTQEKHYGLNTMTLEIKNLCHMHQSVCV